MVRSRRQPEKLPDRSQAHSLGYQYITPTHIQSVMVHSTMQSITKKKKKNAEQKSKEEEEEEGTTTTAATRTRGTVVNRTTKMMTNSEYVQKG